MTKAVATRHDRAWAERVTNDINEAIHTANESQQRLIDVVVAAREGKAWEILGYASWSAYVDAELPIGRAEVYNLLDKVKVVRELAAAADLSPTSPALSNALDIPLKKVRQIKGSLPAVQETIRQQVRGTRREKRPEIVRRVVDQAIEAGATERPTDDRSQVERAATVIPKLVLLSPAAVASCLPATTAQETAKALRLWAERLETATGAGRGTRARSTMVTTRMKGSA